MAASARSSALTDLAKRGFSELRAANDALTELTELTGVDRDVILAGASSAADPDTALSCILRVARRNGDALRVAVTSVERGALLWRLFGASTGLADFAFRHPDELQHMLVEPHALPSAGELRAELADAVGEQHGFAAKSDESAWVALRVRYRRMIARIAAYDLSAPDPVAVLDDVAAALADAAAAALDASLAVARTKLSAAMFTHDEVRLAQLAVIGMGKTGARELNYVSDVDVIFVGGTADESVLSESRAVDVATRLAVQLIRGVSSVETEPALWEVDANLRPEGKQGALVRTLESHLTYYDRWAKSWEFQALLKARPIAGDLTLGAEYAAAVAPKVWTSAARENFVDSVQRMRERVTEHIPAEDVPYQLKLGPGGLRDIEFTVQLLQLVHGLTDETVRSRGTIESLDALVDGSYIGREDAAAFAHDYRVMRVWEHRLQLHQLRRTHLFPRTPEGQRLLARASAMGDSAADLWQTWEGVKREVRDIHVRLFYRPMLSAVAALREDEFMLSTEQAHDRLAAIGFRDPAGALRHIAALTAGLSRGATIQRNLMPVMLRWFSEGVDPDAGLIAFRRISERLGDSPWFLRMLRDSAAAAENLTQVLSSSRYVADLMEWIPESVAWLDNTQQLQPRAGVQLQEEARAIRARHLSVDDAMRSIKAIRRREMLRTALGSLLGVIDGAAVSAAISTITEVAIQATLRAVRDEVVPEEASALDFSVIAMGRLGGAEVGFGSDADVMFVYDQQGVPDEQAHVLALRIVAELRRLTEDSRVPLELDADLRPEGRNGPLARSFAAYEEYYARWSQPWEAQALLRARGIAGSVKLNAKFHALADSVRYPAELPLAESREIKRIKARVENERLPQGVDARRHLKLGPGGLSDVEWLVQLWQMQHAHAIPGLRTTSTLAALRAAEEAGLVNASNAARLRDAWTLASRLRSANTLLTGRSSDVLPTDRQQLDGIGRLLGYPDRSATQVEEDMLATTRRARRAFEKLFYG